MNKQYRLRKDSPCDKAGCIFQWDNESGAYIGVLLSNSQYTADVVENNTEWFDLIVTTATIEVKAEMDFNAAFKTFCNACGDVGIKMPEASIIGNVLVSHHSDELEKCWNAARMNDPFHRGIPHIPKYKHFADYMAAKLK